MAFQLVRRVRTVMLMVPVRSESGFLERAARPQFRYGRVRGTRTGLRWWCHGVD
jgi:hypothetical protein